MRPFVERTRERGLVQGENLTILYRSAEGRPEQLRELARELVESRPDVLVAGQGTLAALAAKEATKSHEMSLSAMLLFVGLLVLAFAGTLVWLRLRGPS